VASVVKHIEEKQPATYFYASDHLGSSSVLTTQQGSYHERIEYLPYGETWVEDKATSDSYTTPYKFTGKELDAETGLYYFGARYYDARVSRWISADPALAEGKYFPKPNDYDTEHDFYWYIFNDASGKLPGMGGVFNSHNLDVYCYSLNNPVKYYDPDGNTVNIPIERQSQKSLIRHGLEPAKKGCWYSSMMMIISALAGRNVDQNEKWAESVKSGYIKSENAQVINPEGLASLAGVNASWSGKIKATSEKIKEQLDKGNVVQAILSDGHSEVINGYKIEDGKLLFTVIDPGYQGDTIIDSETLTAYINYPNKRSKEHGDKEKGNRKVEFISFFIRREEQ